MPSAPSPSGAAPPLVDCPPPAVVPAPPCGSAPPTLPPVDPPVPPVEEPPTEEAPPTASPPAPTPALGGAPASGRVPPVPLPPTPPALDPSPAAPASGNDPEPPCPAEVVPPLAVELGVGSELHAQNHTATADRAQCARGIGTVMSPKACTGRASRAGGVIPLSWGFYDAKIVFRHRKSGRTHRIESCGENCFTAVFAWSRESNQTADVLIRAPVRARKETPHDSYAAGTLIGDRSLVRRDSLLVGPAGSFCD